MSTTPTTTSTSSRRPGVRTGHGCGSAASPSTHACSAGSSATPTASIRWVSPLTPTCSSCETGWRQRGATSASSSSSAACGRSSPTTTAPRRSSPRSRRSRRSTSVVSRRSASSRPSSSTSSAHYPGWCREVVERVESRAMSIELGDDDHGRGARPRPLSRLCADAAGGAGLLRPCRRPLVRDPVGRCRARCVAPGAFDSSSRPFAARAGDGRRRASCCSTASRRRGFARCSTRRCGRVSSRPPHPSS